MENQKLLGLAHREYLRQLRNKSKDDLEYHKWKSDRSICPRRQDFNRMYGDYCKSKYGEKNGSRMFDTLRERASLFKLENPEASVEFQEYQETQESTTPFILCIITPLMKRVHEMVS